MSSLIKNLGFVIFALALFFPALAFAHFGTMVPTRTMFDQEHRLATVQLSFIHPFEQSGMDLEKPEAVKVMHMGNENIEDVRQNLDQIEIFGHKAWKFDYRPKRPGVYCMYMQPQPYWEPAEDLYIKHITKTYVAAYGEEQGWEKPVGLKTEIVPLTRPFGLYAGNTFQGKVLFDGKPVPGAEIEVEYYNKNSRAKAASDYMITQVVRANQEGVFVYTPPKAGWWGFSALNEADYTLEKEGQEKGVELGAVIWIKFLPWKE